MAIAHVAQRANGGSAGNVSSQDLALNSADSIAVGNTLIMAVTVGGSVVTFTVTDPRGNVWHDAGETPLNGTAFHARLLWTRVATAYQSGDVLTLATSASRTTAAFVEEFSGVGYLDQHTSNSDTSSNQSWDSGATGTTVVADELVIGSLHWQAGDTGTLTASGWTEMTRHRRPPARFDTLVVTTR